MVEQEIAITPEMYFIVQGQIGNIGKKADALNQVVTRLRLEQALPLVEELQEEIVFLTKCLPPDPGKLQRLRGDTEQDGTQSVADNPLYLPALVQAATSAEEACALLTAMGTVYEAVGAIDDTLWNMVQDRVGDTDTFLRRQIEVSDMPF